MPYGPPTDRPHPGAPHEGCRPNGRLPCRLHTARPFRGRGQPDLPPGAKRNARAVPDFLPSKPRGPGPDLQTGRRERVAGFCRNRRQDRDAGHWTRGVDLPGTRRPLHLGGRGRSRPGCQHGTRRPVHVKRHVLHAMRGAGFPQDHLLPRPARRHGAIPCPDRMRRSRASVERQSGKDRGRICRMA